MPRVVIFFCGRFPSEKAAAIFVDENATSFACMGCETVVLASRRFRCEELREKPYTVLYLPTLDISRIPVVWSLAGYINTLTFSVSVLAWFALRGRKTDIVFSNDGLPLIMASLFCDVTVYEMHDFPEHDTVLYRLLFRRVRLVISTNKWKSLELQKRFGVRGEKIIIEPNAVDTERFGGISKTEARKKLGLAGSAKLAVYTGHLYPWKGADVFAQAAADLPDIEAVFVGGTEGDLTRFRKQWGSFKNIRIIGHVTHENMPLWQAAADVLVLPNTAKEPISERYTSPMKLFEYMASERPIVASDIPSVREIVDETEVFLAKPDDSASFATALRTTFKQLPEALRRARAAREAVKEHSWVKRAERILRAIETSKERHAENIS